MNRADEPVVTLEFIVQALNARADEATEADTTPLGAVLHAAHILKTLQGIDGKWPATLNLQTGETVGKGRSLAPIPLFQRLNALLDSSEFEAVCLFAAEAGDNG